MYAKETFLSFPSLIDEFTNFSMLSTLVYSTGVVRVVLPVAKLTVTTVTTSVRRCY